MVHSPTEKQRPTPTPKRPQSSTLGQDTPSPTLQRGSNSSVQNDDTNRRQTRGAAALASQQHRRTIDFVSGGTAENTDGVPTQDPSEQPTTKQRRKRGGSVNRTATKSRKKAGVPEQKDDAQTTNTPALPSPAPIIDGNHPLPPGATPDKSPNVIQHVKTRDCLDGGPDGLDQARYRFEESVPPGGSPSSAPTQSELLSPRIVQPTSQPSFPLMAPPEMFPGVQPPDTNNIFDQLRFYQEALIQALGSQNPGPSEKRKPSPKPQPSTSRPSSKHARVKKVASSTKPSLAHRQAVRPSVGLTVIPRPNSKDNTPLDLAMGLDGRHDIYLRIRSRIRKIALNAGIDWTKPWPKVPPKDKSILYQMVRNQIPYMGRFDEDWATSKIVSQYAGHLRAEARSNSELPADPRYDYLKANSAKRRKDAPRGTRPGLAKRQGQVNTSDSEGRDPGPSRAGPTLPNINNAADEDMMDTLGLFGPTKPSDDEDEPDVDNDPDSEG